jgi:hypothetical protein
VIGECLDFCGFQLSSESERCRADGESNKEGWRAIKMEEEVLFATFPSHNDQRFVFSEPFSSLLSTNSSPSQRDVQVK